MGRVFATGNPRLDVLSILSGRLTMNVTKTIEGFLRDERSYRGRRLVEYSLLIAFLVLGSSAILPKPGVWSVSNTRAAVAAGE